MTDTVNSVKEVVKEIMPYLEQAAEKLGTTAQYIWALQVKQGYITGVYYLICWLVWLLIVGVAIRFAIKNVSGDKVKNVDIVKLENQIERIRNRKYKAIGTKMFTRCEKLQRNKEEELRSLKTVKHDVEEFEVIIFSTTIVIIIGGFFWLPSIKDVLVLMFNPEYWALNEVIHLLKGAVR